MYVIGVDVGTSGAKAAAFDGEGRMAARARAAYSAVSPAKGWLELDPESVWEAVRRCLAELAEQVDVSKARALAVSTQGEAMIPVDAGGNALMNAILTFDSRNTYEFQWFSEKTDRRRIMDLTGMPAHPMFSATKLLWIKNHAPETFEKAWKFLCFGDFISMKLGAAPVLDHSMASRTMLYDLRRHRWDQGLLELCGIPVEKLPETADAATETGRAGAALRALGYPADLRIFCGSHDQVCCTLGAGVFEEGVAMDSLGTTESTVCVSGKLATAPMLEQSIPVYDYPGGLYAYMTFLTCSASLLEWYRTKVLDRPEDGFYQEFNRQAEKNRGPSSVFTLPYFAGAGTPHMDFEARGLVWGLTLDTDRYQIYQSILEGACFEQRRNLQGMERAGIPVEELRCIGGGARSAAWLQIKADITGKRVVSLKCEEAGCRGAAILAGTGGGFWTSLREAGKIEAGRVFLPDHEMASRYDAAYDAYRKLYPAVREQTKGSCVTQEKGNAGQTGIEKS